MADHTRSSDLPVSAVSSDAVISVPPGSSLREVARTLTERDVSMVGVGADTVSGIVSERDIVQAVAAGADLDVATAGDLSQRELVWATPEASVATVASQMMGNWVRHILIGEDRRAVGVVSARDLLGVLAAAQFDMDAGGSD